MASSEHNFYGSAEELSGIYPALLPVCVRKIKES